MKNIFKKGFYILAALVLSFATSCSDDDNEVTKIEGLQFVIATLNLEGTEIGVVPTTVNSNNRIIYSVDFGATPDIDTDNIATSGPMVTFEYPNVDGTYSITVTASLQGAADVSITKDITISEYVPPVVDGGDDSGIFDDFEGNGNIDSWFGDGVLLNTALANPFPTGINTSANVLEYNDDGTGQYGNIRFDNATNLDLSTDNTFTIKIYVPSSSITGSQPNQISLKLQDGTVGEPWTTQTEIIKTVVLDEWQELTFDFANDAYVNWSTITEAPIDRSDLNRVVLQVNSENNFDSVIAYIDDFSYGSVSASTAYADDDFEGTDGIASWFGDGIVLNAAFANPYSTGINTSDTVLEYNDDGSGQYGNIRFDVEPNFDLSTINKFTLKIYVESSSITGSQPNQISLKLQDGTVGEPWTTQTEIIKPVVLDQWQEITFDFANDAYVNWSTITEAPVDRDVLNRVVIQMNSENNFDKVIAYIDDVSYHD
tara:strand:- start:677 stop:2131 length:1455 start_codon:yes stop_codon:yes gene_type:complete